MKILFIGPLPGPMTGQSLACQVFFDSLRKSHIVDLIDLSKNSFSQGLNSLERVGEVLKIVWKSSKICNRNDVIYFTVSESYLGNAKDLLIFLSCARYLQRMTIHLHGGAGMQVLLSDKHPILRALNRFFLKRVGAVVVLGGRLKSIYAGIVPPERLHIIPNFAGDEFFVEEAARDATCLSTQPIRLLFLSNLLQGKGHLELLESIALLPLEIKRQLQVDFAGAFASQSEEILFRNAVNAIPDIAVTVHGVVQGQVKRDMLRNAHLFCLPTYYLYEGQPISILEAYASGCSVITTDHSGIFDIFTPGINGLEVQARSPRSIADALIWSVSNTDQLCKYACNNLRDAKAKYKLSTHVDALKNILLNR